MWNVFNKELLETLRDKRTLFFMLLMPAIVVPALLFGYGYLANGMEAKSQARVLRYTVLSQGEYPILKSVLATEKKLAHADFPSADAAYQAIKENKLDFLINIKGSGEAGALKGEQPEVTLEYNSAQAFDIVGTRMKPVIENRYVEAIRTRQLEIMGPQTGSADAVNRPLKFSTKSTADKREKIGEVMGAVIPYILLLLGLSASIAVAIDVGAGEKERGTLESLLLLPYSRTEIVIAKFLLVLLVATVSGAIGLLSLGIGTLVMLEFGGIEAISGVVEFIQIQDLALVALLMLPAFGTISAVLLVLSFFAKSHKEASSYANQLMMIVILPILVAMLPGINLRGGWAFVPLTNISLAVKEIIKGTIQTEAYLMVFGSSVLVAVALLVFCIEWCKREAVLFRS